MWKCGDDSQAIRALILADFDSTLITYVIQAFDTNFYVECVLIAIRKCLQTNFTSNLFLRNVKIMVLTRLKKNWSLTNYLQRVHKYSHIFNM